MAVYHINAGGWPDDALDVLLSRPWALVYTRHAKTQLLDDRHGVVSAVPQVLSVDPSTVFEVEHDGQRLIKICVRLKKGFAGPPNCDLVMALKPERNVLVVVTCWLNHKNDTHKTLKKERYYEKAS